MNELTDAQKRVLSAIKIFYLKKGYTPTIREIADELSLKSTKAVFVHLKNLQKEGYIKKTSKSRTIILSISTDIPVLGITSAGKPIYSEEYAEDFYKMPEIGYGEKFFLKVEGDSMMDAGIFNDDMVLVLKKQDISNGDIGVFLLNGKTTVKRFMKKNNEIYLVPENKNYNEIKVLDIDEFFIIGKVIGNLKFIK